jgi:acetyl-CoA synthetase (ADP-forming)
MSASRPGEAQPPPAGRISIERILRPRSIAVIGASNTPAKFGNGVMRAVGKFTYPGRILPVNPTSPEVMGLPAWGRIGDVPGPVDVAILAVPAERVVETCRACAEALVGCCVVATTGFAELGAEGAARERDLAALSRATGMRVLGPNCMGFISPSCELALTSSLIFDGDCVLAKGRVGLVSQSGGLMVSIYDRAATAGIGFSACVSLGNQCDLEICDFLEFLIDDPETDAICLYAEALKNPRRFLALAEACRRKGKPLLMVKAGRTAAGAQAALSHTASLAGPYAVLEAACRERGVLLMEDPDDMVRAAEILVRWGRPQGEGIGLVSTSGGSITAGVDRLDERGLRLAEPSPDTCRRLSDHLIEAYARNPVDLGGARQGRVAAAAGAAARILAEAEEVPILLVILNTSRPYEAITRQVGEALLAGKKPFVVVFTPGAAADAPRRVLRDLGCPYFDNMDSALRVLAALVESGKAVGASEVAAPCRPSDLPAPGNVAALPDGRLTEPEVKCLVAAYGIPVTRERVCRDPAAAVRAAAEIDYPVAVKAICRGLVHKSDVGAVRLDVATPADLAAAWQEVVAAAGRAAPGTPVEGVLVQAMYRGDFELLVGVRREGLFGPVVVVGAGGTAVELFNDIQTALAPVSAAAAGEMLRRLRIWPLLKGWRGKPAADLERIADVILRLSWLAADLGEKLIELEVNPLIVRNDGACAVDARATFSG